MFRKVGFAESILKPIAALSLAAGALFFAKKAKNVPAQRKARILNKIKSAEEFKINLPPHSKEYQKEIEFLSEQAIRDMFPDTPVQKTKYDSHSQFVAIELNGKLAGVVRLILEQKENPDKSFQVNEYPDHLKDCPYKTVPIENIAEISRVYVSKDYRQKGGVLALLKGTLELCAKLGITHVFSMVSPELNKEYEKFGLYYKAYSKPFDVSYKEIGIYETIYFTKIEDLINNIPFNQLENFLTKDIENDIRRGTACCARVANYK